MPWWRGSRWRIISIIILLNAQVNNSVVVVDFIIFFVPKFLRMPGMIFTITLVSEKNMILKPSLVGKTVLSTLQGQTLWRPRWP